MGRLLAGMFAALLAVACGAEVEMIETVEPSDGGAGGSTTATATTGGAGGEGGHGGGSTVGTGGEGGRGGAAVEPACETDDDCGACERCGWPLAIACLPLDDCDDA